MKKISLKYTFLVVILFGAIASVYTQPVVVRPTTPEQSGDEKLAAGDAAGAMFQYKTQWASWMAGRGEGDPDTQANRERLAQKMGNALAKMASLPALGDETELHALKGAAFVKQAADYEKAVKEFQDAVNGAPWVFDYHFNLAVSLKSAGQFKIALGYARVAKLLAQTDKDRRDALSLRAEIEAAGEMADGAAAKAQQEKAEAERVRNERAQRDSLVEKLHGIWVMKYCGRDGSGCNEAEKHGSYWYDLVTSTGSDGRPWTAEFGFPSDGSILIDNNMNHTAWAGATSFKPVYGVPGGTTYGDIVWEARAKLGEGAGAKVYSEIGYDGSWITISCDRPLSGANPNTRYHYLSFSRPK